MLYIEEHQHCDMQDTRNIQHFFRLGMCSHIIRNNRLIFLLDLAKKFACKNDTSSMSHFIKPWKTCKDF